MPTELDSFFDPNRLNSLWKWNVVPTPTKPLSVSLEKFREFSDRIRAEIPQHITIFQPYFDTIQRILQEEENPDLAKTERVKNRAVLGEIYTTIEELLDVFLMK